MKQSAFDDFSEGTMEVMYEAWDFKTCKRSDGTTYGTSGDCAQKGSKEVKKSSSEDLASGFNTEAYLKKSGYELGKTAGLFKGGGGQGLFKVGNTIAGSIKAANKEKERKKAEERKQAEKNAKKEQKKAKKAKAEKEAKAKQAADLKSGKTLGELSKPLGSNQSYQKTFGTNAAQYTNYYKQQGLSSPDKRGALASFSKYALDTKGITKKQAQANIDKLEQKGDVEAISKSLEGLGGITGGQASGMAKKFKPAPPPAPKASASKSSTSKSSGTSSLSGAPATSQLKAEIRENVGFYRQDGLSQKQIQEELDDFARYYSNGSKRAEEEMRQAGYSAAGIKYTSTSTVDTLKAEQEAANKKRAEAKKKYDSDEARRARAKGRSNARLLEAAKKSGCTSQQIQSGNCMF